MGKRILALLLAVVMVLGLIPTVSSAPETETELEYGSIHTEGTTGFGNLLSDRISQTQEKQAAEAAQYPGGYGVTGLVFSDKTAAVSCMTMEDVIVVVAIYSEDGMQLITTARTMVMAGTKTAEVTFGEDLPEYFTAAAYMLDTYDHSPLCAAYETPMYTRQMQELLASTVDDYDQERVLNLDEDSENNFAVYASDTILISQSEGSNIVTQADHTNAVYVIENPDESIRNLKSGDIFAYPYKQDDVLLVKVESIEIEETAATITGAELQMTEVFEAVKINQVGTTEDFEVDESKLEDWISYDGIVQTNSRSDIHLMGNDGIEYQKSMQFSIEKDLDKTEEGIVSGKLKISGTLALDLNISAAYYQTGNKDFFEAKIGSSVAFLFAIDAMISLEFPLPEIRYGVFGCSIGLAPEIEVSVSGKVEFSITTDVCLLITYSELEGMQANVSVTYREPDLAIECEIFLGVDLKPVLDLGGGLLADLEVEVPVGFSLDGRLQGTDYELPQESQDTVHGCESCLNVDVSFKVGVDAKLKLLKIFKFKYEESFSFYLFSFYYSFTHQQLGFGTCPYKSFLTTVAIFGETGDPAETAWLTVNNAQYEADANGIAQMFLPAGTHIFEATDGQITSKMAADIDSPGKVQIQLGMEYPDGASLNVFGSISSEEITDYGYALRSGTCGVLGDNVRWTLYSNGTLKLTGYGRMRDYEAWDLYWIPWYSFRSSIKAVVAEGIENIGSLAFYDSCNIQSLKVSNSVKEIGWDAFGFNYGLKTIEFGTGLTRINSQAFQACNALTSVSIPGDCLEFIGGEAFNDCYNLNAVYIKDLDAWCSIQYETLQSNPLYYAGNLYLNGKLVTKVVYPAGTQYVYGAAFANCNSLETVAIPGGARVIGAYAFYGCDNLKQITIPNSVKRIDYEAFRSCISLEQIDLPDYLTSLPDNLFYNCQKLTGIQVPEGVSSIGSGAFYGCESLHTVTLPSGLDLIAEKLFYGCSALTDVTIPATVETIGSQAFYGCASLEQITIPRSVKAIGTIAFAECRSLTRVYGHSLEDWCAISLQYETDNPLSNGADLYLGGVLVQDLTIPTSITTVGPGSFTGCTSLRSLTIPDHITEIGYSAFANCDNLKNVHIGNSVTLIDDLAFSDCDGLISIVIPDQVVRLGYRSFEDCDMLEEVVLGDGVTTIDAYAFRYCPALKKLTLGGNITTVDYGVLYKTEGIETVYVPSLDAWLNLPVSVDNQNHPMISGADLYINGILAEQVTIPADIEAVRDDLFNGCESLKHVEIADGVTAIGNEAFSMCVNLQYISIPETVRTIGYAAFRGCSSLSTVTIPDSVTELGHSQFSGCTSLTNVKLPGTLALIENSMFSGCTSLTEVSLPSTVSAIEDYAFENCAALTSLDLPDGVETIGRGAFYGCESISTMVLPEGLTAIPQSLFSGCTSLAEVTLPDTLTDIGKSAFYYCTALSSLTIPDGVTAIGDSAFCDCRQLRSLRLPASLTAIGADAFYDCESLTQLHIPNGVTAIKANTFSGCDSLLSIHIPEGVTSIGSCAFSSCDSLAYVSLPDTLTAIYSEAFAYCRKLEAVLIPAAVKEVGSYAFSNCTALRQIVFLGDAPVLRSECFCGVTADAFYPAELSTWTASVMQNYGGTISWNPADKAAELVLIQQPLITCYVPGEPLDLGGMQAELIDASGNRTVLDHALIRARGFDTSTTGRHTVTLTYANTSASYDIFVHPSATELLLDSAVYPETPHNATQPDGTVNTLTWPGARYLTLTFSELTNVNWGNYIYVYNGHDQLVQQFAYDDAAGVTVRVPGDTVKLVTDASYQRVYGYSFDSITAGMVTHDGELLPGREPTCTEEGTADSVYCEFCEQPVQTPPIPPLGHEYQSVITAPTPESNGYTTHTCIRCGDTYVDSYTIYDAIDSGTCGDGVSWVILHDGTLRIIGEGPMDSFSSNNIPWNSYREHILSVQIGSGITSIGSYAFRNCVNLLRVEIADSVETIENYAFYYCTSLSDLVLPESVSFIGNYAFRNCTSLTSLSLPDCLTALGSNAFSHCSGLTQVRLGSSLNDIGSYAFRSCSALQEVTFFGNAPAVGSNAFYGVTAVCHYPGTDTTWTESVMQNYGGTLTWIPTDDASKICLIDDQKLNSGSELKGSLEYVQPQSPDVQIEAVYGGQYSTEDTENYTLKTASFEGLVPGAEYVLLAVSTTDTNDLIADDNLLYITQAAAAEDGTLSFQYIQKTAEEISYVMVCGASNRNLSDAEITFEEMTANGSVQVVHPRVVYDNTVLTEGLDYVVVGTAAYTDGGTYTCYIRGIRAYTGMVACSYTVDHVLHSGWSGDVEWALYSNGVLKFTGNGKMKNYTYKTEMPWFQHFDAVKSVIIEEGVTAIGAYAFYAAPNLESIEIAPTVTTIGDYAFKNAPRINNVVLPDGLTSLGDSAFYACTGLTSIEIPAGLWTIQPYTFKNCADLTSVTFHEGNLQKISDGAFYGTGLTELVLPDCLDILDVYAFKGCADLTSITIGSGLTELREAVFYGTAIPTITIPEGITKIGPYAFKNCVALETIDLPESLTSIGEASFYADTALREVILPNAVTAIGNYAFRKCAAIEELVLSEELTTIGECAFYGCTGLSELVIPDQVTTIKPYAFKTCTGLTSVVLGESVKTIGEGAFNTCTGLKTIVFPASLEAIDDYAFSGSYNLWKLTFEGNAPAIGTGAFKGLDAYAYYPSGNTTWNSSNMLNYGGKLTWKAQ